MSIYAKILNVMQDVSYLAKDGKVEFGNTKYKAISEEKVTSIVRASMIKNGLVMFPIGCQITKDGNITTTQNTYKLVDIETGESEVIASCGQGSDSQDKGAGKAMTYAGKYALLKTFLIPTGEDPDKISSEELDDQYEKDMHSEAVEESAVLRKVILTLGTALGKDAEYTKTWCEKLFGNTTKWADMNEAQLTTAKLKLSEKVQSANKGK